MWSYNASDVEGSHINRNLDSKELLLIVEIQMFLCSYFISKLLSEIFFISGTKKAPKFVTVHEMKWDSALRSVLSAVHAVTCCYTVR